MGHDFFVFLFAAEDVLFKFFLQALLIQNELVFLFFGKLSSRT